MLDEKKKESLRQILTLIEQIVGKRQLSRLHHRDEVEKFLNFILQGRDMINPYERRNADVSDDLWAKALSEFRAEFGLMDTGEKDESNQKN